MGCVTVTKCKNLTMQPVIYFKLLYGLVDLGLVLLFFVSWCVFVAFIDDRTMSLLRPMGKFTVLSW